MKTCTKCGETKPLDSFGRDCSKQDGLRPNCKLCVASYYATNRSTKLAKRAAHWEANKPQIRTKLHNKRSERQNLWRAALAADMISHVVEYRRAARNQSANRFRLRNLAYFASANAKRRASELQATPVWADPELIALFYATRQYLSQDTGEKWHVDHVVPLQGRNVCGLHVHFNLCVVPAKFNMAKSNKFPINHLTKE